MNTTLTKLAELLTTQGLLAEAHNLPALPDDDIAITGADCDSQAAAQGHLFICKGAAFKAVYLADALVAGAVAYLCDETHAAELAAAAPAVPALITRDQDLRRAMSLVSAEAWGHPDRDIDVLGITGTKGKSTCAYMLRSIFDADEKGEMTSTSRASILGSIVTYDGVEEYRSHNTTPEAPDLWRHLTNARDSHHTPMVMEISSQGLKYDRVDELALTVGCFLNIGRDHISAVEHPDFEDYFASKLRIFEHTNTAVVNLGTDHVDRVLAAAADKCDRVVTFSDNAPDGVTADGHKATIWADHIEPNEGFIDFTVHTDAWVANFRLNMQGLFNIENALCAIAVAHLMGVGRQQIRAGLAACRVPGRMELIDTPDRHVMAIVDYAHNKLSFQKFFGSVAQEFPNRKIIAVFGAPGDKAQERRQELPQEASKCADAIIFTEDDPAHERVEDINAQLIAATPEGQRYESIPDRPAAIARAVEIAYEDDTPALLCLLAKGHETHQHEGDDFVACETDGVLFARAMEAHQG